MTVPARTPSPVAEMLGLDSVEQAAATAAEAHAKLLSELAAMLWELKRDLASLDVRVSHLESMARSRSM